MRPPPMGYGHVYAVPGHIVTLRGEAIRRNQAVEVKEKVNYTGRFSKSVYTIKQGPTQNERALSGQGGATELHLTPQGEIIQMLIDEYFVLYIEPLSLPHRHNIPFSKINYLVPELSQGEKTATNTQARGNAPAQARAKQQPQIQKKKPAETDESYDPRKKVTIKDKGHNSREKSQAKKKIDLVKKADLGKKEKEWKAERKEKLPG